MNQPLLPSQQEILLHFDKWLRKTFNSGTFGKQPPYTTKWHHDAAGNILLDNGRMALTLMTETTPNVLYSLDTGDKAVISSSDSLSKLLLDGLHHAIQREFVSTYS